MSLRHLDRFESLAKPVRGARAAMIRPRGGLAAANAAARRRQLERQREQQQLREARANASGATTADNENLESLQNKTKNGKNNNFGDRSGDNDDDSSSSSSSSSEDSDSEDSSESSSSSGSGSRSEDGSSGSDDDDDAELGRKSRGLARRRPNVAQNTESSGGNGDKSSRRKEKNAKSKYPLTIAGVMSQVREVVDILRDDHGKKSSKRKRAKIIRKSLIAAAAFVMLLGILQLALYVKVIAFSDDSDSAAAALSDEERLYRRLNANHGPASWTLRPDRERRAMSSKEVAESLERFGVPPTEKNPKLHIARQITNPEVQTKTNKRTFGCLRDECRGLALEDLTNRKWKMMYKNAKIVGPNNSTMFRDNLNVRLTWLESDTTELTKLKKERPETFEQAYTNQIGKTYLSVLDGADAIGGNKGQQLRGKQAFVRRRSLTAHIPGMLPSGDSSANSDDWSGGDDDDDSDDEEGAAAKKKRRKSKRKASAPIHIEGFPDHECTYNDLSLQPAQYRLYFKEECEAFLRNDGNGKSFLLKPETGSQGKGITFHAGVQSVKKKAPKFFPCKHNPSMSALERVLVQEYIAKPLLLEKCKFDLRVYMLIASSDPWMVFYHEGYLRRSLFEYSASSRNRAVYLTNTHYQSLKPGFKLSEHIWTFERLQSYLTTNARAGGHYVDSVLDPYIKRAANFVFQSARQKLQRRKGSFHIFGLDFMIDDNFKVHFIEANGYPGYTWSINFDTRSFVAEQFNLVMELHEHPTVFEKMRAGDRYGHFELIFSELEEAETKKVYDPCYEFFNNDRAFKVLGPAMQRFAKYTGFAASKALLGGGAAEDLSCQTKKCKAKRREARVEAAKARHAAERMFEGYIDDIGGAELIGGLKTDQISTLARYARQHGCVLNKMFLMPATYRMYMNDECSNVVKYRTASAWLAKPMDGTHGSGFEYFSHQRGLERRFRGCEGGKAKNTLKYDDPADAKNHQKAAMGSPSDLQFIVQKYVGNRLLVRKRAWDIRAYMLIACTEPFFVFYHDGYVRTTELRGDEDDPDDDTRRRFILGKTELTFDDFQILLSQEAKTGDHFMTSAFETYAKQVMRLLFHAVRPSLTRRQKSYQVLELTFALDDAYTFWYIGANNSPQLSRSKKVLDNVIMPMQDELKSVVLETSDSPEALAGMRFGDRYGDFRLVYSEYEDDVRNTTFNPCEEFRSKWSLAKSAVLATAKVHDYKTRVESANSRELGKYTRAAWQKCRVKGKVETCMQSDYVRKKLREQYEIYLDKSSVGMSTDKDEEAEAAQKREELIQAYIEDRINQFAGIVPSPGGSSSEESR